MTNLNQLQNSIRRKQDELAAELALADAAQNALNDKERLEAASKAAITKAIKAHFDYGVQSGNVTAKLAEAYLGSLDADRRIWAVAALVYDTGADPGDYGYILPSGYAERARNMVDGLPASYTSQQIRTLAIGEMLREPPELPTELSWADRAYVQGILGNDPLT